MGQSLLRRSYLVSYALLLAITVTLALVLAGPAAFAESVLAGVAPAKGTLVQAWQATRIFEAFAEGPGRVIELA